MIVPGRPARDALLWWMNADGARVSVRVEPPVPPRATVVARPLGRELYVAAASGLEADREYELVADFDDGRTLRCRARTLPKRGPGRFTFAVGSCYGARDNGRLATLFPPRRFAEEGDPVRFRASLGDQIYVDLPITATTPDVWRRYDAQWRSASWGDFLRDAPNLFLPDDHEYWNNFPHSAPHLLWTPASLAAQRDDFQRAYDLYQGAMNLHPARVADPRNRDPRALELMLASQTRTFALDDGPVPMFFLDLRSRRGVCDHDGAPLAAPHELLRAREWLHALTAPGVLFVPQPLVPAGESLLTLLARHAVDCFPADYKDDFALLCEALFAAPHDVLVVSGDIHFDRLLCIERTRADVTRQVFELCASPYSHIANDAVRDDDLRRPSGQLTWKGDSAGARWRRLYAHAQELSFTTVTLVTGDAGAPVKAEVRVWGDPGAGHEAALVEAYTVTLW